jgi:hypothetical protein
MKNKTILFLCLLPLSSLFFVSSCSKQSDYTQNLISNYQRVYPNGFDSDPIFVEKTGSYLDYFNNLNNDQKLDCLNFTLYNFILKNNLEVVAGFNLQSNDSLIKLYKSNKIDINLTINSYQFYKNASDDQN